MSPLKNLSMIVWLTQLGLSVALPLVGFILLAAWLNTTFSWGAWVYFVGAFLGIVTAFEGLRTSLKAMKRLSEKNSQDKHLSFNDHI